VSFDSTEFPATTRLFVAGDPYSSTDGQLTNRRESFHRPRFTMLTRVDSRESHVVTLSAFAENQVP